MSRECSLTCSCENTRAALLTISSPPFFFFFLSAFVYFKRLLSCHMEDVNHQPVRLLRFVKFDDSSSCETVRIVLL
jgi:hypothetical protein